MFARWSVCAAGQAVEAEVADFLEQYADLKPEDGHQRVVRYGYLPERAVMTDIGVGECAPAARA